MQPVGGISCWYVPRVQRVAHEAGRDHGDEGLDSSLRIQARMFEFVQLTHMFDRGIAFLGERLRWLVAVLAGSPALFRKTVMIPPGIEEDGFIGEVRMVAPSPRRYR